MRNVGQIAFVAGLLTIGAAQAQTQPIRPVSAVEQPGQGAIQNAHPLVKPIRIGEISVQNAQKLTDYSATLYRKMWLGSNFGESTVRLKYRSRPFSVYLFFDQPHAGREVLYVDGWNQNRMLAHEGSGPKAIFGSMSLDPNGRLAMEGSKYPITKIGLANLAQSVVDQWKREMQFQRADQIDVKLYPEARLANVECKVVETVHKSYVQGIQFHKTRLFLTRDSNLPFAVQQFAFPRQQGAQAAKVEDVRYQDLKINVGFTAADFDPKNPAYKF